MSYKNEGKDLPNDLGRSYCLYSTIKLQFQVFETKAEKSENSAKTKVTLIVLNKYETRVTFLQCIKTLKTKGFTETMIG